MKTMAFRFNDEVKARIKALARPNETMTAVLLRGIAALETDSKEASELEWKATIEKRVAALENKAEPAPTTTPVNTSTPTAPAPTTTPKKRGRKPTGSKKLWE